MVRRMNVALPVAGCEVLTAVAGWAWWCMTWDAKRWASWVDRENNFWRDKGLISASLAERLKRFEKGRVLKWLAGGTALAGLVGVALAMSVLYKEGQLENRPLRLPYNPALQRKK